MTNRTIGLSCVFALVGCLLAILLHVLAPNSTVMGNSPDVRNANKLLRDVSAQYRGLQSYEDEGEVISTIRDGSEKSVDRLRFKILYKRPTFFAFQWTDYYISEAGKKSAIWCNGRETFFYQDPNVYERKTDLEQGIAAATGVSFGASYSIPRLLIQGISGWMVTDLSETMIGGEETFEGDLCIHITGLDHAGDKTEIWINKKTLHIRKIRTESKSGDTVFLEEEIHRSIRTNRNLTDAQFDFVPPVPRITSNQKSKAPRVSD